VARPDALWPICDGEDEATACHVHRDDRMPEHGQSYFTGIETDRATFDKLPDLLSHARCPHCGVEHPWRPHDAWLRIGSRRGCLALLRMWSFRCLVELQSCSSISKRIRRHSTMARFEF
jgi:hypothetical protein